MLPVLHPNDMIVVEHVSVDDIAEGDIIAFDSHQQMGIVAHRAIAIYDNHGQTVMDTKGDNNEEADPWYVTDEDLIGKVIQIIPGFGILLVGPVRFALVAVIIILAISMMKDYITENKNKSS
jgi:signal peptidase